MRTSDYHVVLFTKENCPPCKGTKDYLKTLIESRANTVDYISTLKKENHQALVEAYGLTLYPVLLIVNSLGEEQDRIVGGNAIKENLAGILRALQILDK